MALSILLSVILCVLVYVLHKVLNVVLKGSATFSAQRDAEWVSAMLYSKIPGPKPIISSKFGNVWRFSYGEYSNLTTSQIHEKLFKIYGPIVKLGGLGHKDIVMLFDPTDAEKVANSTGPWPIRRSFPSLEYHRATKRELFGEYPGIVSTQGREWKRNRDLVYKPMMNPKNVLRYHDQVQEAVHEFVELMKDIRDANLEMPHNFIDEVSKFTLEVTSITVLGTKTGGLKKDLDPEHDVLKLIHSMRLFFEAQFEIDFLPSFWEYYSTPAWKKFVANMDLFNDIAAKWINKKIEDLENRETMGEDEPSCILEAVLRDGGRQAAFTMGIDLLFTGIDTSAITIATLLYFLAKNPADQEKVYQEVLEVLTDKNGVLPENFISKMPYLKACMKESQRLRPIGIMVQRESGQDLVIQGYRIPKGTDVMFMTMAMSHMEKHFPRAKEFLPERWSKNSALYTEVHPLVCRPFGHGARSCVGQKIVELQVTSLTAQIIRNYKIGYNYGETEWAQGFLQQPKGPLKFKVEERT